MKPLVASDPRNRLKVPLPRPRLLAVSAIVLGVVLSAAAAYAAGTVTPQAAPAAPTADWEKYATQKADRIVVYKSQRRLELRRNGAVIRTYHIALGRNPVGAKAERGDGRTPEGTYTIDRRNILSPYHVSLHISYPSKLDRQRADARHMDPGGNVLIHGEPNVLNHEGKALLLKDWTAGCIGMKNLDVDEVWRLVDDGTPIDIFP
jgi:murein L,D-transpeptidase YafK